eukprot:1374538-Amorphochlora_amoeboformis.AAC.1
MPTRFHNRIPLCPPNNNPFLIAYNPLVILLIFISRCGSEGPGCEGAQRVASRTRMRVLLPLMSFEHSTRMKPLRNALIIPMTASMSASQASLAL